MAKKAMGEILREFRLSKRSSLPPSLSVSETHARLLSVEMVQARPESTLNKRKTI